MLNIAHLQSISEAHDCSTDKRIAGRNCSLSPPHQSRLASFSHVGADTFRAGVSNLAQNNGLWRVIVSLAEMRKGAPSSRALRPVAS